MLLRRLFGRRGRLLSAFETGQLFFNVGPEFREQVSQRRSGEARNYARFQLSTADAPGWIVGIGKSDAHADSPDVGKIEAIVPGIPPRNHHTRHRVADAAFDGI